jgi:hypothetical protein
VTLSLPAKLAAYLNVIAPNITADIAAQAARLMPRPGGIGTGMAEGRESASVLSPSIATVLGDRAALANNELPAR